jgi:predicted permease
LVQDFRNAVRALRASPLVSIVAILSLALGIGANAAIFSITDRLILRPLPVREPDRLAILGAREPQVPWSNPVWEQLAAHQDLFDGMLAYSAPQFNIADSGEAELIDGLWVSGSFFEVLGVGAQVGRVIGASDDQRSGGVDGPVAVISDSYWRRQYNAGRDVIGRTIKLDGLSYTIVGVTSPRFFGPAVGESFDVAVPLATEAVMHKTGSLLDRPTAWLQIMARLKPGQSVAAATAALRTIQRQVREATLPAGAPNAGARGAKHLADPFTLYSAATGSSFLRDRYQRPLIAIMTVVGLVLLIACGNIANLMLARATARRHELSVRRALGASRGRIARQLLIESAVLALIGGSLGVLIAMAGSRALVQQLSTDTARVVLDLSLDWKLLAFTASVAIGTALLFGTAPALRGARVEPSEVLKEQGRGGSAQRAGVGSGLVIAQVALSLVLVVAAGLFTRTFGELAHLRLGFDRERVVLASVRAGKSPVPPPQRAAFYEELRQSVLGVPGVASAAMSRITPVSGSTWNAVADVIDGRDLPESERSVSMNLITPAWFATYGTPLIGGRDFAPSDNQEAPRVAIVNQTFARTFINGGSPLGRTIRLPAKPDGTIPTLEIIGVAGDAIYRSLREPIPPTIYVPMAQQAGLEATMSLAIRSRNATPAALTHGIANALTAVDRNISVRFRDLGTQVDSTLVPERVMAMLSAFFGGLALLLAGLGLYGVTLYAVNRRRAEIGIRLALGTSPATVIRLVLRRVAVQVAAGVGIGAVLSLWATHFVKALLYGLAPQDPLTMIGASIVLAGIGAIAGWLPARRIAAIDPAVVLRMK